MAPIPGKAFLDRVIVRVHASAQDCRTQAEHQLTTITLRLLSQIKHHGTADLDQATQQCFGFSFAKFREKTQERQSLVAWELAGLIPDYDPEEAKRHANVVTPIEIRRRSQSPGSVPKVQRKGRTRANAVYATPEAAEIAKSGRAF